MIELIRRHPGGRVALIEPGRRTVTYAELRALVDDEAERLLAASVGRGLVFLGMGPELEAVVLYLACLRAELPVCLVEPHPVPLLRMVAAYQPALLLLPASLAAPQEYQGVGGGTPGSNHKTWRREQGETGKLHPDLALLLTTSGSTGNPKLVRLSARNLESNAIAIGRYLALTPDERAIQSLPAHYSYGLSVLNSHLAVGASVVLTQHSFMRPEFWAVVDELRCTSFAGVPYMYETLHRLRFAPGRHASLRTLTQAGGALRSDLIAHFHGLAALAGIRFFVMYGQTEATARISFVPPERLGEKIGSIGIPIPGGALELRPVAGAEGWEELVYSGPNVMMGYAEGPADLANGDVQGGVLRTGDLGRVDAEGYFSVTGRLQRFAKLFGRRVSLEDIERDVETSFPIRAAALDGGDRIVLFVVTGSAAGAEALANHVAGYLNVPPRSVCVQVMESLPLTTTGKKDYKVLEALAKTREHGTTQAGAEQRP